MKTLTKAQRKHHERLRAARDAACQSVFDAVAPRTDVRFQACLQVAAPDVRSTWESACSAQQRFEDDMVADGRAWRASFGMFTPY